MRVTRHVGVNGRQWRRTQFLHSLVRFRGVRFLPSEQEWRQRIRELLDPLDKSCKNGSEYYSSIKGEFIEEFEWIIPAEVKETIKQRATSETIRWQFERILLPSEIKAKTDWTTRGTNPKFVMSIPIRRKEELDDDLVLCVWRFKWLGGWLETGRGKQQVVAFFPGHYFPKPTAEPYVYTATINR